MNINERVRLTKDLLQTDENGNPSFLVEKAGAVGVVTNDFGSEVYVAFRLGVCRVPAADLEVIEVH